MGSLKLLLRNIVAAVAGVVLAFALIFTAQVISSRIYPPPEGLDYGDKAAMTAFVRNLPIGALIAVLLGYFVGVAAGSWLATRLSVSRHARQGMMVGVLFFVASLVNLTNIPHPVWFWAANLLLVPLAAWLGLHFGEPEDRPLD